MERTLARVTCMKVFSYIAIFLCGAYSDGACGVGEDAGLIAGALD